MPGRFEAVTTELRRIRAQSSDDIAVLMAPLIEALERGAKPVSGERRPQGIDRDGLAAMANSLAQVAAQAGDAETAVAIASIQAEIEALAPVEPAAAAPVAGDAPAAVAAAASNAPPGATPARPTLRRRPLALLFTVVAAAALSYGAYVVVEQHFGDASLLGWLVNATTTVLAPAAMLWLGQFLAGRLSARRLRRSTGLLALVACGLALSAYLRYGTDTPIPVSTSLAPETAASDGSKPRRAPAPDPDGSSSTKPEAPGNSPAITLWWLGEVPSQPQTPVIDGDVVAARAESGVEAQDSPTSSTVPPPDSDAALGGLLRQPTPGGRPAAPTPMARYAQLIDHDVLLLDRNGVQRAGTLTGVNRDGVTLRTEVTMFGQPILAHRFFLHEQIRELRAQ